MQNKNSEGINTSAIDEEDELEAFMKQNDN